MIKKEFTLEFTNVRHDVRRKSRLLLTEYVLLDMAYHLQVNPKSNNKGWCYMSQETIGKELGITRQGVSKMIKKLISLGWLEKNNETKFIKTTEKWYQLYLTKDVNLVADDVNLVANDVNLVAVDCKLSLHNNNTYTKKDKHSDNIQQKNSLENLLNSEHTTKYGQDMITEFKTYWNTQNGKQTNFDKQKIFDIEKRLATWFRNANNIDNLILHNRLVSDPDKKKAFLMLYPNQDFEKAVKLFYVDCKVGREGTSYKDYVNHFFNKMK